MGLGLAAMTAWWQCDLAVYAAIRLAHPIRGWRPDRAHIFGVEQLPAIRLSVDRPAVMAPASFLRQGLPGIGNPLHLEKFRPRSEVGPGS